VHNIRQIESNESLELDKRISKLQFRRGTDCGRCGKCTETHPVPLDPTLNDTVLDVMGIKCFEGPIRHYVLINDSCFFKKNLSFPFFFIFISYISLEKKRFYRYV